ncbi:flagellar biosynthetic protein FliP, partial [Obesumbacterium proteus]|nr:flagellar biosynthetic protein FliP [Obesumbacterium proteus]
MRRWTTLSLAALLGLGLLAPVHEAWAANSDLLISRSGSGENWSLPLQTLVLLTSLTFLPAVLLMMTGFTRIIIV